MSDTLTAFPNASAVETAPSPVDSLRALRSDRRVMGLLGAYAGFRVAEFGVWVTLAAAAYAAGGVREATLLMLVQLVPAATAALTVGWCAARFGAARTLRTGLVLQAVGMLWVAITLTAGAPRLLVGAGAVIAASAVTTTRPSLAGILPGVVPDAPALAPANALVGWVDGAATLVGPLLAAALMALAGPAASVALFAVVVTGSACAVGRLDLDSAVSSADAATAVESLRPSARRTAMRGVLRDRRILSLTATLAVVAFLIGALDLIYVVTAVELLGLSEAAAGWLNAAVGLGMMLGGATAAAVSFRNGGRRLVLAAACWGGALLAVAATTNPWVALTLLLGAGAGAAVMEITARTMLQRTAATEVVGHAFAAVESAQMAALALGALTVGAVVERWGPSAGLIVPGSVLCVFCVVAGPQWIRSVVRPSVPQLAGAS